MVVKRAQSVNWTGLLITLVLVVMALLLLWSGNLAGGVLAACGALVMLAFVIGAMLDRKPLLELAAAGVVFSGCDGVTLPWAAIAAGEVRSAPQAGRFLVLILRPGAVNPFDQRPCSLVMARPEGGSTAIYIMAEPFGPALAELVSRINAQAGPSAGDVSTAPTLPPAA